MLQVNHLKVHYDAIQAVKDISFTINEGEIITLLGANGAGKTSTLMAIAGAITAKTGSIQLYNKPIERLSPEAIVKLGIATVPENRDVFADLTVNENLMLGAYIHRQNKTETANDLKKMQDIFPKLKERAKQAAGTLSGGEQQMLVIARALMSRPKLLLLDEPSLGLAPAIVEQIFIMIKSLQQSGITILLVEQNATKALEIADRAFVLRLGEVVSSGDAKLLTESEALDKLYFGGHA